MASCRERGSGERREERKRQEEERKASTMAAIKLAAEQAAELAVDRERRIQLWVGLDFCHRLSLEIDFITAGFGGVGHDTGTVVSTLYRQG